MSSTVGREGETAGEGMSMKEHIMAKGTEMLQSMKPLKKYSTHVCTFALYSHDMNRQIETHHFVHRLNEDFSQCAVYDSDDQSGRLIGIEYIVSDRIFEGLLPDEQKLWHSHHFECDGVADQIRVVGESSVPEAVAKPGLENLAKTYGKFWCTWQTDRGDLLPIGEPALMMSPQGEVAGMVKAPLLQQRDKKYSLSTTKISDARVDITGPTFKNPNADYWIKYGKGFAVDVVDADMKKMTPFP